MSTPKAEYEGQLAQLVTGALDILEHGLPEDQAARTPDDEAGSPVFGPYHAAAAVLATFDRSTLKPLPDAAPAGEQDELLDVLADSTPVLDAEGHSRWKLLVDVRRELLQRFGNRDAIQRALDANPERASGDPVQRAFEAYVGGTAARLEDQDVSELAATFEVAQWLEGIDLSLGSALPDLDAIRCRSDYLTLLQPFEELAGTNFAGRRAELQALREYVGVLPPGSLVQRTVRAAREVFNLTEKPPLVIHGPGGVGKSALISRFIWEHATVSEENRFPWIYLDFDRASLRPEEPLTLLIEAVRQVGLQYDEARPYADRVRAAWQDEMLARYQGEGFAVTVGQTAPDDSTVAASTEADWRIWVSDFASLLANVRQGRDPCLFVLDTFEEVQYRGETVVVAVCEFLQIFQRAVPRLRIVVAGRAPLSVPGFPTDPKPLGDFDDAAALQFLEKRGVSDPTLAKHITKRIGRSPLSLLLAATAVKRAEESGEAEEFDFKGPRGARLTEAQIQGMLYRRILEHIRDEEVAKLAYPGLVLRRVTPDIIQRVLAEPCEVSVPNEAAANELFDRLAHEVSLVHFEEGALVHRRDVRRMMLPLLRDAEADAVRKIEEAAITYYESREGALDRAEEIYHRLSRHQPLDVVSARWTDDAKPYLFNALDENELGVRERAWLLPRLDPSRKLDEEEQAAADLETWEWDTEAKVRELLGRNRLSAALDALRARSERSLGSPLYLAEVETLERMKRWPEARGALETGIESAGEKGDTGLVIDLLARAGSTDIRLGNLDSARERLSEAAELVSNRPDDAPRALRIGLAKLELARLGQLEDSATAELLSKVQERFDRLSEGQVLANPALAAWAAAELGPTAPDVFRRVIDVLGLPLRPRQLRTLARAIAEWDDMASQAANHWKGLLGGEDLPWAETLTQAWTQLIRDLPPPSVGPRISQLLRSGEPPPDVLAALESVMVELAAPLILRETAAQRPPPIGPPQAEEPRPETSVGDDRAEAALGLNGQQVAQLHAALLEAFPSRDELALTLTTRLGRSLDSISLTENMAETVFSLIQASLAQGWTGSLLAAAIESRPDNVRLREFAEPFGLVAVAPVESVLESHSTDLGAVDPSFWRSRLGVLEGHVCRIGVRGGAHSYGTGLLVAPDLVLTAYALVGDVVEGRVPAHAVDIVFDYKTLFDGFVVNRGTVYGLRESDWLVSSSPAPDGAPSERLDYALLRMVGAPGTDPIGGDRAETGAAPRGWTPPPRRSYDLMPGNPLFVLHHESTGRLLVAASMDGVIGLNPTGTRLHYRTDLAPGSIGAPCFDINWELVAMHEGRDPSGVNQGVPISIIVRDLEARGLSDVLYKAMV